MSPACLKLPLILCLVWTAVAHAGVRGVQWRESGGSITIQCRSPDNQDSLDLRLGLNEEIQVFHRDGTSGKEIIVKEFAGRLQTNAKHLNVDILIKNLSPNDTGPYSCSYKKYDTSAYQEVTTKGDGSVLLVVKDKHAGKDEPKKCGQDVILVCVVIVGAMLLIIITGFVIWIVHKQNRSRRSPKKPRRVATNEVYEEMRGTLRH